MWYFTSAWTPSLRRTSRESVKNTFQTVVLSLEPDVEEVALELMIRDNNAFDFKVARSPLCLELRRLCFFLTVFLSKG